MPYGCHLSKEYRSIVYYHHNILGKSASIIHEQIFCNKNDIICAKYLSRLCRNLDAYDKDAIDNFLKGPLKRGGSHEVMSEIQKQYLLVTLKDEHITCLKHLHASFLEEVVEDNPTSYWTTWRAVKDAGWTRKTIEHRHVRLDHEQRYNYVRDIAFVDPETLIDVDETASSTAELIERYGWAPKGNRALGYQIEIGGHHYSTIAAYSPQGFLCWEIVEGGFDSTCFERFLTQRLYPLLEKNCILLDNAKLHKTNSGLRTIERVSDGRYVFVPAYSPDLKPIELAFGLVKRWIRARELQALQDPLGYINQGFERYSIFSDVGNKGIFHLVLVSFTL
jgi:transposase